MDQTAKPLFPCPAAVFFRAAGRPVLPLSFSLGADGGQHLDRGGGGVELARAVAGDLDRIDAFVAQQDSILRV